MTEGKPARLDRLTAADLPVAVAAYRLVAALGERGEGRVFRAESAEGVVELTAIWPSLLASDGAKERVTADLARAEGFRAPGAVTVQGSGQQRRSVWFASTPMTGVTLAELVDGEVKATPPQVLMILAQVLDTLAAAHSLPDGPLLHAGLTPERIVVADGGQVAVRGFGLGGLPLTTGGGGGSTPGDWASPEQVGRRALVPGSDLFAVGAIAYRALTGKAPFRASPGAKPSERVGEIVRVLARGDLFRRVERLALGLGTTLQGFLGVDPGSRHASAGQAAEALRAVAGRMPATEPLATLVGRVLVDHAATVAAPGGAWPTSRDLRPLDSLVPQEAPGEDTADTDADFLLPSQRLARQQALAPTGGEGELTTAPGRLTGRDGKRTHVVSRDAIPSAEEATVAGPGPAPRVGAASLAASLAASRPAPVPAPPPVSAPQRAPVPAPRPGAASQGAPLPPPVPVPRREPVPAPRMEPGAPQPPAPPPPMPAVGAPRAMPPGWTPPRPGAQSMPTMPPRPGAQSMPAMPPRPGAQSMPAMPPRPGAQSMPAMPPRPAMPPSPGMSSPGLPTTPPPPPRRARSGDEDEEGGSSLLLVVGLVTIILGLLVILAVNLDGLTGEEEAAPVATAVQTEPAAAPTPAPPPPPAPAPEEPPTEEPTEEPTPEPTVEPTPEEPAVAAPRPAPRKVEMPSGPVTLSLRHRPLKRGQAGSSDLVSVRLDGPGGAQVVLHYGPPGGPFDELPLREKSGGRYEEWLNFPEQKGASLAYWITATHPAAPSSASSGSRSAPHTLTLE